VTDRPRVANTRDESPDGPLARALAAVGLVSWHCPTIAIAPADNPQDLVAALAALERFDWVVFTSAHAVDVACRRPEWQRAAGSGAIPRLAAVGRQTARRLADLGYLPDVVPEQAGARPLTSALVSAAGTLEGTRVLWPRSNLARRDLAVALSRAGATVVAPVAYRTVPVGQESLAELAAAIEEGRLDAIAFCSPSSAENLVRGLSIGDLSLLTERVVVGSIGPTTSAALASLGRRPDVEAAEPSAKGLASALASRLGAEHGGQR
jgi:uroporphyrinogen-III synthase